MKKQQIKITKRALEDMLLSEHDEVSAAAHVESGQRLTLYYAVRCWYGSAALYATIPKRRRYRAGSDIRMGGQCEFFAGCP